jgi:hypothetical protein
MAQHIRYRIPRYPLDQYLSPKKDADADLKRKISVQFTSELINPRLSVDGSFLCPLSADTSTSAEVLVWFFHNGHLHRAIWAVRSHITQNPPLLAHTKFILFSRLPRPRFKNFASAASP